jgi:hypothetical protein
MTCSARYIATTMAKLMAMNGDILGWCTTGKSGELVK